MREGEEIGKEGEKEILLVLFQLTQTLLPQSDGDFFFSRRKLGKWKQDHVKLNNGPHL